MNNVESLQDELSAALKIWSEASDSFSRRCNAWALTLNNPNFSPEQKQLFHRELKESERQILSIRERVLKIEFALQRARGALMRGDVLRLNERQRNDLQPAESRS
jgi:hypothetical protein